MQLEFAVQTPLAMSTASSTSRGPEQPQLEESSKKIINKSGADTETMTNILDASVRQDSPRPQRSIHDHDRQPWQK